jgi:nicotinate-nucleotide adenylyltransferase
MRIALFGGSFAPPHLGHVLAASYVLATARPDALWVLPAVRHPYDKQLPPLELRLELCRLAFASLVGVSVRDDEARNPSGFTIDLVEALDRAHPGTQWLLVGGTDTARDMPKWKRGAELLRLVEVVAVPRRGYDDASVTALPAISSTLIRTRRAAGDPCRDLLPAAVAEALAGAGANRGSS